MITDFHAAAAASAAVPTTAVPTARPAADDAASAAAASIVPDPTAHAAFTAVTCGDGLVRCPWAVASHGTLEDHDHWWGHPVTEPDEYFAALCLELLDAGLARWSQCARHTAWYVHLADLQPRAIARLDDQDVDDLLEIPELIRNRAKIEAVVHNARICRDWDAGRWEEILEPLTDHYGLATPHTGLDLVENTSASRAVAATLRAAQLRLVGPVTAVRWAQRVGRAPSHVLGCFRDTRGAP